MTEEKDPAVLWYWNDWIGGTLTFSRALKGAYMDLLGAQHNSGHLSLDEIKTVLGSDFGSMWPTLQKKFAKDDNGLFYNARAKKEKEKRKNFTSSRRKNLKGSSHMENGNINGDEGEKEIEIVLPFNSEKFISAWGIWKKYKNEEHKFSYKSKISEQAALKSLSEMSNHSEDIAIKIMYKSISNGWEGLFELKNGKQTTNDKKGKWAKHFAERTGAGD